MNDDGFMNLLEAMIQQCVTDIKTKSPDDRHYVTAKSFLKRTLPAVGIDIPVEEIEKKATRKRGHIRP